MCAGSWGALQYQFKRDRKWESPRTKRLLVSDSQPWNRNSEILLAVRLKPPEKLYWPLRKQGQSSHFHFCHCESAIIYLNQRKKASEDKVRNLIGDAISHLSGDVRSGVLTHQLSAFFWAYYSSHFWNSQFLREVQGHPSNNRKLLHNIPVLYLYVVLVQRGIQLLPSSSVSLHTWYKSLEETL